MEAQIELLINAMKRLRELIGSEVMNIAEQTSLNQQLHSATSQVNRLVLAAKLHGCEVELEPPTQRE